MQALGARVVALLARQIGGPIERLGQDRAGSASALAWRHRASATLRRRSRGSTRIATARRPGAARVAGDASRCTTAARRAGCRARPRADPATPPAPARSARLGLLGQVDQQLGQVAIASRRTRRPSASLDQGVLADRLEHSVARLAARRRPPVAAGSCRSASRHRRAPPGQLWVGRADGFGGFSVNPPPKTARRRNKRCSHGRSRP